MDQITHIRRLRSWRRAGFAAATTLGAVGLAGATTVAGAATLSTHAAAAHATATSTRAPAPSDTTTTVSGKFVHTLNSTSFAILASDRKPWLVKITSSTTISGTATKLSDIKTGDAITAKGTTSASVKIDGKTYNLVLAASSVTVGS